MYTVRVSSTDNKSPSFTTSQAFNITVTDENDPPYDLKLTGNQVNESAVYGTHFGLLSATDEDANPKQSLTFSIVDSDGGRFAVFGNGTLYKANSSDYETSQSHRIQVKVSDNGVPATFVCFYFQFILTHVPLLNPRARCFPYLS